MQRRNKIELTNATKACSQNSLFYKGISLFNSVPENVKNENSVYKFNTKLKDVIMERIYKEYVSDVHFGHRNSISNCNRQQ